MQDKAEEQQQTIQEIQITPEDIEAAQEALQLFPSYRERIETEEEEEPVQQVEQPVQPVEQEESPQQETEVDTAEPERLPPVEAFKNIPVVGDTAQGVYNFLNAPFAGAADAVIDQLNAGIDLANNKVPGVTIPGKLRKQAEYRNGALQTYRELGGRILAEGLVTQAIAGRLAQNVKSVPLLNSAFSKVFGTLAVESGVSAQFASTDPNTLTDANLFELIEKHGWGWVKWISPDFLATRPDMTPQQRRVTHIGADSVSTAVLGAFGLFGGLQKAKQQTRQLVKDFNAAEAIKARDAERAKQMAEYGKVKAELDPDNPHMGANPELYDPEEDVFIMADKGNLNGAIQDAAEIYFNKSGASEGSMRSVITDAERIKFLAPDSIQKQELVIQIADGIKKAPENKNYFSKTVTPKEKEEALDYLAEQLVDPRFTKGDLIKFFKDKRDIINKQGKQITSLSDDALILAQTATSKLLNKFADPDILRAQGYLAKNAAEEISGLATGVRLRDGVDGKEQAMDLIFNRLKYLMIQTGVAKNVRGTGLQVLKQLYDQRVFKTNPKAAQRIAETAYDSAEEALEAAQAKAAAKIDALRDIMKNRPHMLKPFIFALEMTDGDVNSMYKMTNLFLEQTGTFSKGIYDAKPELPSRVLTGMQSVRYNDILNSLGPPTASFFGNSTMIALKPIQALIGAALEFPRAPKESFNEMRKVFFAHRAMVDGLRKTMKHTAFVMKKAIQDPQGVRYAMRDDMSAQLQNTIKFHRLFAEAAQKEGNEGPMVIVEMMEFLEDLGNTPMLRFGTNLMTAMDGGTRAINNFVEARYKVYEDMIDSGKKFTPEELKAKIDEQYYSQFDEHGYITNKAIEKETAEMTLQLDTKMSNLISRGVRNFPVLKGLFRFNRTMAGMAHLWTKYDPMYRSAAAFTARHHNYFLSAKNFSQSEKIKVLQEAGKDFDPKSTLSVDNAFRRYQYDLKGRVAIGVGVAALAGFLVMEDRITGDGYFDPAIQRFRQKTDWKPRQIIDDNGNRFDFNVLGPLANVAASIVNIHDNYNILGEVEHEKQLGRAVYTIAAHITEQGVGAQIADLIDFFNAEASGLNRILSRELEPLGFQSGLRSQLQRVFDPYQREFDRSIGNYMRNRYKPVSGLPYSFDPIDGGKINPHPEQWWQRFFNELSPIPVSSEVSPIKQYLHDMQVDYYPLLDKVLSTKTKDYERSDILRIMGDEKFLANRLKKIMARHPYEDFRKKFEAEQKKAKANGFTRDLDYTNFDNVIPQIKDAFREAVKDAIGRLDYETQLDIVNRREIEAEEDILEQRGVSSLEQLLDPNRNR